MKLARRQFLQLATMAAGLPTVSRIANAQTYPARPVRIVVGFAAGGAPDIAARLVAQWLSERLRPQVLLQKPAGSAVHHREPAGCRRQYRHRGRGGGGGGWPYALLINISNAVNATLYQR